MSSIIGKNRVVNRASFLGTLQPLLNIAGSIVGVGSGGGGGGGGEPEPEPPMTMDVGALDSLDASLYTDAVGAYGTRLIYQEYTGAQITIRRSSDNAEADIYFNSIGNPKKLVVVSTQEEILDPSIETWLDGATAYVKTWYDQSANAKHLVQTTASEQPIMKHDPAMCGYVVHFVGTRLSAPNLFATDTISNMHFIGKSKEVADTPNYLFMFNGQSGEESTRFTLHSPWNSNRSWMWSAGNSTTNRATSTANITLVGEVARFSATKSSELGFNRLVVNGSTFNSSTNTVATVSGGMNVGKALTVFGERDCNHYVQYMLVYSMPKTETLVSDAFSKMDISECPRESPQFTANSGTNNIASDYNSKYGWETNQGWVASASSTFDTNRAAWKAFNKTIRADSFDRWLSASGAIDANGNVVGEEWIRMDFPEPVIITQYSLSAFWVSAQVQTPIRWMLEAYDGSAWIGIGDEVSASTPWTSAEQTFIPSKQTFASSSWRLNIFEALPTDGGLISISELKFHTKKTVA